MEQRIRPVRAKRVLCRRIALRAQRPHGGACGFAGGDAHGGVFNHQATFRCALQVRGCGQIDVRSGFAGRQLMAAEDAAFKPIPQANFAQLQLDLATVSA